MTKWLKDHDYFYEYKVRTRDKRDGCLTAFKKSRFELQESKYIEFFVHEDEVILNRDNIAQILVLKTKFLAPMSDKPILLFVLNTHLLFNLRRGEIKAAQLYYLLQATKKLELKFSFFEKI